MSEKIGNQLVKADAFMLGILQSLMAEREKFRAAAIGAQKGFEATQDKIEKYVNQCAGTYQLSPAEWMFSDQDLGFVPRPVVSEVSPVPGKPIKPHLVKPIKRSDAVPPDPTVS